jgi:hypothetical protein
VAGQADQISMNEHQAPPHKFVVGIHSPGVPNPCEYALSHGFDFACTFISRPQLEDEIRGSDPKSAECDEILLKNAVLHPSGSCPSIPRC